MSNLGDGSWACPNCTVVNSIYNLNCATCLGRRPDADLLYEQTVPFSSSEGILQIQWECPKCSCINNFSSVTCKSCRFERTNGPRSSSEKNGWFKWPLKWPWTKVAANSKPSGLQWECPCCTLHNSPENLRCKACGWSYLGGDRDERSAPSINADPPLQPHPSPSPSKPHPSPSPSKPHPSPSPSKPHPSPSSDNPPPLPQGDGSTLSLTSHTTRIADERHRHRCDASITYERVRQYQRKCGEPFVDPDFPPADCSLYIATNKPVTHWKGKIAKWLRPSHIFDPYNGQWTVFRNPSTKDIMQGALGNCWMLSALAVIAQLPHLLREIIISDQYCPEGIYQLRLCIDGEWTIVNVDDLFPCRSDRQLVFSKTYKKQLWVPLVEKGLAKLYHSYEALHSGSLITGLSVLTGLPCEKVVLKGKEHPSSGINVDSDLIWAKLLSFKDASFPMAAACGEYNVRPEDIQGYEAAGLELDHAYSILDVMTTDAGSRRVKLRNPWGHSAGSQRWVEHNVVPEYLKPFIGDDPYHQATPTGHQEESEGDAGDVFTLEFSDFLRYFHEVAVCKYRPEWESTRMKGKLYPFARPHLNLLTFEVLDTSEVDVSVYQPTVSPQTSTLSAAKTPPLVDLCVLVMRCSSNPLQDGFIPEPLSCEVASGSHIDSIVTCTGVLRAGYYVVLPLAFNHWHQSPGADGGAGAMDEQEGLTHMTALFTAKPVLYSSALWTSPGFLAESLFLLAIKEGKKTKPFQNAEQYLYTVSLPRACNIFIAENRDSTMHFTVMSNHTVSINIVSTRGEMFTIDCIPPHHRQVLAVLTNVEQSQYYILSTSFQFYCSQTNSSGQWGASHTPQLHPSTEELHCPRAIGY